MVNKLIILGLISFFYFYPSFGQERVNLSVGMGLPELLNIGVRYQVDQVQYGLAFGFIPLKEESLISVSGDVYYHFSGFTRHSNRRPWYARMGLNYLRDETSGILDQYLYLNMRVGRDFNFSEKFGLNIDAGVFIQLLRDKENKLPPGGIHFDLEFPLGPGLGIGFFYRI